MCNSGEMVTNFVLKDQKSEYKSYNKGEDKLYITCSYKMYY